MTWITFDNVQSAVAPKAGKSELRFLCFANCIMEIYICIKFQENIWSSFQVTECTQRYYRNHYLKTSKGHISKSYPSCVLHLVSLCFTFVWSSIKIFGMVFNVQSGYKYIVEIAVFNIYYVQRATIPRGPWWPCNTHLSNIVLWEPDLELIKANILIIVQNDYTNK